MSHDYFIFMSYGASAAALLAELAWLRFTRTRALRRIEEERDLEAQD